MKYRRPVCEISRARKSSLSMNSARLLVDPSISLESGGGEAASRPTGRRRDLCVLGLGEFPNGDTWIEDSSSDVPVCLRSVTEAGSSDADAGSRGLTRAFEERADLTARVLDFFFSYSWHPSFRCVRQLEHGEPRLRISQRTFRSWHATHARPSIQMSAVSAVFLLVVQGPHDILVLRRPLDAASEDRLSCILQHCRRKFHQRGDLDKAYQTPVVTTYYVAFVVKGAPFASFPMIGISLMFRKNRDKLARQLSANQSPISEVISLQRVSKSPYSDPWLFDFRDLVSIVSAEFSIKGHIILDSMAEFYLITHTQKY